MRRPQLSIRGLTGIIALVAVAFACLLNASAPWAVVARIAFYVALLTAPLGALNLHGSRKAFYQGFTIWGWGYLALSSMQAYITDPFLDWAYETTIPLDRQSGKGGTERVDVPQAYLPEDMTFERIRDVLDAHINIRIEGGGTATGLFVNEVKLSSAEIHGRSVPAVALALETIQGKAAMLREAMASGKALSVTGVASGRPTGMSALLPVDQPSFERVADAIIGIVAGLIGGVVGQRFHARREA